MKIYHSTTVLKLEKFVPDETFPLYGISIIDSGVYVVYTCTCTMLQWTQAMMSSVISDYSAGTASRRKYL